MEDKRQIVPMAIEESMKEAYVDYAMSVIVARALPDVRDGFKPVHRRIIYTMFEEHITPDKKFRKSASTVGNVLAHYHPHGDASVYDAMVRLAQPFNMRYPLVWPQGNFGSVDGDSPAHMRYTEAKLSRISMEMIRDIGKNTVDWRPNFDNSTQEPVVLPALLPNLIINGAEGIAVGMATKIPPHNLREVVNGLLAYLDNPDISLEELMLYIPGPDFPTGATICGQAGIKEAYATGRGSINVRSVTNLEQVTSQKQAIIVTEIPFQVNKAKLVEEIADKVNNKVITGITDLRDESSRKGIRIVIELAANANARVVLNHLFVHTRMQCNYNAIMLALVNDVPKLLTLKEILGYHIEHRRSVVTRRTQYELEKAQARDHIVVAILKSLEHIDEIIAIIESSEEVDAARVALMQAYGFTDIQAQAILDMRLQRLTGLEYEKFSDEHAQLLKNIEYYQGLLADIHKLDGVIREELLLLQARCSDPRRTKILSAEGDEIRVEDLITNDQMVVTVSKSGYAKRVSLSEYREQRRGGRGRSSLKLRENDSLDQLFTCRAHDQLLFLTNMGRIYRLKVYELPSNKRTSMGTALVNLLSLSPGEKVVVTIPVQSDQTKGSIITLSRNGFVKRTSLSQFLNIPTKGKVALRLDEDDELETALYSASDYGQNIGGVDPGAAEGDEAEEFDSSEAEDEAEESSEGYEAIEADESSEDVVEAEDSEDDSATEEGKVYEQSEAEPEHSLLVVTKNGRVLRFSESSLRCMGRISRGVKSIILRGGDSIVSFGSDTYGSQLVIISENGFGKRMRLSEFAVKGRRGQGVIGMLVNEKIGPVAAALVVRPEEQLMISTAAGVAVRIAANGVTLRRRASGGVRVMNVAPGDRVVSLAHVVEKDGQELDTAPREEELEGITALEADGADLPSLEETEALPDNEDYSAFYENLPEADDLAIEGGSAEE